MLQSALFAAAFAATGDQLRTQASTLDVVLQPEIFQLEQGESRTFTVELEVSCEVIFGDPSEDPAYPAPAFCIEDACSASIFFDADVNHSNLDVQVDAPFRQVLANTDGSRGLGEPGGPESVSVDVTVSALPGFSGGEAVVSLTPTLFDVAADQSYLEFAGVDIASITLEVPVNGDLPADSLDGHRRQLADLGSVGTTPPSCANSCVVVDPYPGQECYIPSQSGDVCLVRLLTCTLPHGPEECVEEDPGGDFYYVDCPTSCPGSQVSIDGACACENGESPDENGDCPSCPVIVDFEVPKADALPVVDLPDFRQSAQPLVDVYSTSTCDNPYRPRFTRNGVPLESTGGYFELCRRGSADFVQGISTDPSIIFSDGRDDRECRFDVRYDWNTSPGQDSPPTINPPKLKVRKRSARVPTNEQMYFSKFKLKGKAGKMKEDQSLLSMNIHARIYEDGRQVDALTESLDFCTVPKITQISDIVTPTVLGSGEANFAVEYGSAFEGRYVQEFIVPTDYRPGPELVTAGVNVSSPSYVPAHSDTCQAGMEAKAVEILTRLNSSGWMSWTCASPPPHMSGVFLNEFCSDAQGNLDPNGVFSTSEQLRFEAGVRAGVSTMTSCLHNVTTANLSPWGKLNSAGGVVNDIVGVSARNSQGSSDFCQNVLTKITRDSGQNCTQASRQLVRMSCSRNVDDSSLVTTPGGAAQTTVLPQDSLVFLDQSLVLEATPTRLRIHYGNMPAESLMDAVQSDLINSTGLSEIHWISALWYP